MSLWYLKHFFPITPVVVKTKGLNVPYLMPRTLLEYRGFFSLSCIREICCGVQVKVLIRFSVWVTDLDPNIKECRSLELIEPTCVDIQSGVVVHRSSSVLSLRFSPLDFSFSAGGFLLVHGSSF